MKELELKKPLEEEVNQKERKEQEKEDMLVDAVSTNGATDISSPASTSSSASTSSPASKSSPSSSSSPSSASSPSRIIVSTKRLSAKRSGIMNVSNVPHHTSGLRVRSTKYKEDGIDLSNESSDVRDDDVHVHNKIRALRTPSIKLIINDTELSKDDKYTKILLLMEKRNFDQKERVTRLLLLYNTEDVEVENTEDNNDDIESKYEGEFMVEE